MVFQIHFQKRLLFSPFIVFLRKYLGLVSFFWDYKAWQAGRTVKWGAKVIKVAARNQVQGSLRSEDVKLKDNFCYLIK